jgi:hypothetical protein
MLEFALNQTTSSDFYSAKFLQSCGEALCSSSALSAYMIKQNNQSNSAFFESSN